MTLRRFSNDFRPKSKTFDGFIQEFSNFFSVFIADVRNLFDHGVTTDNLNAEIQDVTFTLNQPLVIQALTTKNVRGAHIINTSGVVLKTHSVLVTGSNVTMTVTFDTTSPVRASVYIFGS